MPKDWYSDLAIAISAETSRLTGLEEDSVGGWRLAPKHNPEAFDSCDRCLEIASELLGGFNA